MRKSSKDTEPIPASQLPRVRTLRPPPRRTPHPGRRTLSLTGESPQPIAHSPHEQRSSLRLTVFTPPPIRRMNGLSPAWNHTCVERTLRNGGAGIRSMGFGIHILSPPTYWMTSPYLPQRYWGRPFSSRLDLSGPSPRKCQIPSNFPAFSSPSQMHTAPSGIGIHMPYGAQGPGSGGTQQSEPLPHLPHLRNPPLVTAGIRRGRLSLSWKIPRTEVKFLMT